MTQNDINEIKSLLDCENISDFWFDIWSIKFRICSFIILEFEGKTIQDILNYKEDRITEICGEYYDLVQKIFQQIECIDISSSHVTHDLVRFASDFILRLADKKKDTIIRLKQEKIKELEKEIKKMKNEICD